MRYRKKVLIILLICVILSVAIFHSQTIKHSNIKSSKQKLYIYQLCKQNSQLLNYSNQSVHDVRKYQDEIIIRQDTDDQEPIVQSGRETHQKAQNVPIQKSKRFDLKGYLKVNILDKKESGTT